MASVFKKHSKWYLSYRGATGRRVRRVSEARTKTEARRMADDLERRCERQRLGLEPLPQPDGGGTVAELLKWWLDNHSKPTASHGRNVAVVRKWLIRSELGTVRVAELTTGDVQRYLREISDGLSPQSLRHLRNYLSRAYSAAIAEGRHVGHNPIRDVKSPRIPKRPPSYLKAEEVPPVLAALSRDYRPLFATAIYAGLRKGELFALRKQDVDLEARLITVGRSHDRNVAKGGNADPVPIASELVPYLRAAMDASPSPLVFPGADGRQRPQTTKLPAILRRAMGRAGIVTGYEHRCRRKGCSHKEKAPDAALRRCPEHGAKLWPKPQVRPIRFHDLRHTTASLLLQAGVSTIAVQRIMRHSDPRLTTEVYGHLSPDYLQKEVDHLRFGMPVEEAQQAVAEVAEAVGTGTDLSPVVPVESPSAAAAPEHAQEGVENRPEIAWLVGAPSRTRTCDPRLRRPSEVSSDASNASQPVGIIQGGVGRRVQRSQPVADNPKRFVPVVSPRLAVVAGGAEDLLTVREAAKRLGVSTWTVYNLCERGELAHLRVSNSIRVAPVDLAAFVERQRGGSRGGKR